MKKMHIISILALILITIINVADARGREVGFRGRNFHPEHPNVQYRHQDLQHWQHGNGHGYTYQGAHYNYYHNGTYFNYYHGGSYYNYYYRGNYYNYYNNGLYYLYFFNGLYYNNCKNVPRGYPHCP